MAEDDSRQLIKRFSELAERAEKTSSWQETKFLNMAEQAVLNGLRLPAPYALWGGYEGAERRIAYFGSEALTGYPYEPPTACLCIAPAGAKFADELSHRDFLGSLMALGLARETLGDIVIHENRAYLFCLETVAGFICDNLTEVRRTSVVCAPSSLPESVRTGAEERSVVIASERLDAVIAAVWKLSREEAKALCEKGLVFVNARLIEKGGAQIEEGAVVSVRGRGRFTYLGPERSTKKGKLRVRVSLPIPS